MTLTPGSRLGPYGIDRVNPATGERTRVRELAPPDRAGLISLQVWDVTGDGAGYAYYYWRHTSGPVVSGEIK